jgi:integrase
MGIRKNPKSHTSPESTSENACSINRFEKPDKASNPLIFWTKGHKDNSSVLVNLEVFSSGEAAPRSFGRWAGPFSGRPQLILELAPIIKSSLEDRSPSLTETYIKSLREWWRLFDLVESRDSTTTHCRVSTVGDINIIHRQVASDNNMHPTVFRAFVRIVNAKLLATGLPQLHWVSRRSEPAIRHIPTASQIEKIRATLKRRWFKALDIWEMADRLTSGETPKSPEEERLLKNYRFLQDSVATSGHPRPSFFSGASRKMERIFYLNELDLAEMLAGFYPNAQSVRVAFHLCQLQTGWNASVLLSLDVSQNFIEPHPKDPKRYLLRGFKHRAKTRQIFEGLYKTQASPGGIITELIRRTEPLRSRLKSELNLLELGAREEGAAGSGKENLDVLRAKIQKLRQGVASPWLFVTRQSDSIQWLNENSASTSGKSGKNTFLEDLIQDINQNQLPENKIHRITGGDFRDAFAASIYARSGGQVLHVMKALGHKSLRSTQVYLENNIINERSEVLYRKFSESLWHEIKISKKADPSVLAKWARDGEPSESHRLRLHSYRSLMRSRLGIGCKDPTEPPKNIAPNFIADGSRLCHVQRCTLCENAVVFPESIQGLSKRVAELNYIKSKMSIASFLDSSFHEELLNTEEILEFFDSKEVVAEIDKWTDLINNALHQVIEFDGS